MSLSRRRFLKQTFGFSAAALLSRGAGSLLAAAPASETPDAEACHVLAVGDFGVKKADLTRQKAVADGMARYVTQGKIKPQALALLGDNFYGGLDGKGVDSPRWDMNVESMYPASALPCPMFAMLGNHDYDDEKDGRSVAAQLAYRQHAPNSRWTMPSKWYRFELGDRKPVASFVVIDTNLGSLSADERKQQSAFIATELAKPRTAPWLFVLGHHPVFSDGSHGDTPGLKQQLEPLLRTHHVDLYLSGHDHDLQHLEFAGHPTSFVISGGGGAHAREVGPRKRSAFGQAVYGFSHLELNHDRFVIRHLDANGKLLHAFAKTRDGHVTPLAALPARVRPAPVRTALA